MQLLVTTPLSSLTEQYKALLRSLATMFHPPSISGLFTCLTRTAGKQDKLKWVCGSRYGGNGLWDDQKKLEKRKTGLRMWFLCTVGVNPVSSGEGLVCFVMFDLVLNAAYVRIVYLDWSLLLSILISKAGIFVVGKVQGKIEFKKIQVYCRIIMSYWRTVVNAIFEDPTTVITYPWIVTCSYVNIYWAIKKNCCFHLQGENEDKLFLRNVRICQPNYTASHTKIPQR